MDITKSIHAVIEIIAEAKNALNAVSEGYKKLPKIAADEYQAVKMHSIQVLDEVLKRKNTVADEVERFFSVFQALRKRLVDIASQFEVPVENGAVSLSDFAKTLQSIDKKLDVSGAAFAKQVFSHQLRNLEQSIEVFEKTYQQVKPEVERNKVILEQLLYSHHESYKFWLDILEETESSYNAKGMQKSQGRSSAFKVTA